MSTQCQLCHEQIKDIKKRAEKCVEEMFLHFHEALEIRDKCTEIMKNCENKRLNDSE